MQKLDIRRDGASGSWETVNAGLSHVVVYSVIALVIWWTTSFAILMKPLDMSSGYLYILGLYASGALLLLPFLGACLCCTAPHPPARRRACMCVLLLVAVFGISIVMLAFWSDLSVFFRGSLASLLFGLVIAVMASWFLFHVAVADFFQVASLRFFSILTAIVTPVVFLACVLLLLGVQGRLMVEVPIPGFIAQGPNREFRFMCFILLVSNTIILGMSLVLCIKTIRIINSVPAAGF